MQRPTNEDEGEADAEGQDVTAERLVVFPITLCKHAQPGVDVVFAQSLDDRGWFMHSFIHSFISLLQ